MKKQLVEKYQEISSFIYKHCQRLRCFPASLRTPVNPLGFCCDKFQCEFVFDRLKEKGIKRYTRDRRTMMFVKGGQCIVPPHLRPICAVHACDRLQCFAGKKFMQKFLQLRDEINRLERRSSK